VSGGPRVSPPSPKSTVDVLLALLDGFIRSPQSCCPVLGEEESPPENNPPPKLELKTSSVNEDMRSSNCVCVGRFSEW